MKTSVKIAIIGAIATVLAAVIPIVISIVIDKNGIAEKPRVTPYSENDPAGDISIKNSANVIVGDITTGGGDVIIGGTKTTDIQTLSEGQNNGAKQENEY